MNAIITREQLQKGLAVVGGVAANRCTLPILSHVLLQARGDHLFLTATDLDITISTSVDAQITKPGELTLPAKKLAAIAKELPLDEVEVDGDKNTLKILAGGSSFKVLGFESKEFPPVRQLKEAKKVSVPQDKLLRLLKLTDYAISTDESRYVLNGILFIIKEGAITCVATDGRRLALASEDLPDGTQELKGEFIVPTKSVNEIRRLLGDKGNVEISFSASEASFNLTDEAGCPIHLLTKLVEGTFPNYKQVIPDKTKFKVQIRREELLNAVSRARLLTSLKSESVRLRFSKNSMEIKANSPDVGEAKELLDINFKGEVAIAFNPDFLIEPLKAVETEDIILEVIDELSPGIIRHITDEKIKTEFLYVLMPMRLSDSPAKAAPAEKTETPKPEKEDANKPEPEPATAG